MDPEEITMKRVILLLAISLLLAAPVAAYTEDFQNPNTSLTYFGPYIIGGSTYGYVAPQAGGNGYYFTDSDWGSEGAFIRNKYAYISTYAAATQIRTNPGITVRLFDNTNATLDDLYGPINGRFEVVISGGVAKLYKDGNLVDTSVALAQNPSYIGFGSYGITATADWDNIVIGDSDSRYVFSVPTEEWYYLKKDMINPAAYGFYYTNNNTLISSTTFPARWSRSSPNLTGGPINESIYFINTDTGTVYATYYTGNNVCDGSINVNFKTALIDAGAPYGLYALKINTTTSDPILYKASGASVVFDKDSYNYNDVASITWGVETDYWDTSTYDYVVGLVDSYGTYAENYTLTERTGTFTHTFTTDDKQGAYYAVVVATKRSDSSTYWLAIDYAELDAYFNIRGYVNDAQTTLPISGANVTITQGSTKTITITIADGNYTFSGGLLGTALTINATAAGYSQYYALFSPTVYGTKDINITLNSTTPTYTGLGIGGVDRDGSFNSTTSTITSGYGRPIPSATCYLKNTTNAELYSTTTNNAGWYLFDESTPAILTSQRPYDLWCEKIGYGNSANYMVVAA